jgi:glycosyltransferase involved in cell wall biosynthesis
MWLDFQHPTGTIIDAPAAYTGYGRMGVEVAAALAGYGVELTTDADVRVIASNLTGIEGFWTHQRRVVWTMWESDRLPESFKGWFERVDQILVPCRANVELFSQHHADVRLMPLGVHERWQPTPRSFTRDRLVVLAGGRGSHRKGIDLAIAAFEKVNHPTAELWLRLEGKVDQGVRDAAARNHRIRLIGRVDDEPPLYRQAHVFLAPSRGEGWGLMPLQAMAQGCPTILTDAHGHAEFATYATGPLRARKVPSALMVETGSWWEPDIDDLADCLADHLEHPEQWAEVALRRAEWIGHEFRWRPDRLMDLIGATSKVPERGMFEAWAEPRVHLARVVEPITMDHPTGFYRFEPGRDYMVGWDVWRGLRDAQELAPEVVSA